MRKILFKFEKIKRANSMIFCQFEILQIDSKLLIKAFYMTYRLFY